jgi:hypothetical protein
MWLYTGSGLVIGFTELLNNSRLHFTITITQRLVFSVTVFTALLSRGFQRQTFLSPLVTTVYKSLSHRLVFSVTVFLVLFSRGFQRQTFPFLRVPKLSPASATSICNSQLSAFLQSLFPTDLLLTRTLLKLTKVKFKVKIMLRPTVTWPVCLGVKDLSGAWDQIFITVRQLRVCWCEVPSLMKGWVRRLQLLLALAQHSHSRVQVFYSLKLETPPTWMARSLHLYPPGTGCPSYTPGTGLPFQPLLLTDWSQLVLVTYSLSMDHTENTASNSSSTVAWARRLAMALALLRAYEAVA